MRNTPGTLSTDRPICHKLGRGRDDAPSHTHTRCDPGEVMAPARTRWRAFAEDAEVGVLVDHVVVAQRDAAVARASLERLLALCRPVAEQIARTYVRSDDDVSDM